jgi:hypothetical protein
MNSAFAEAFNSGNIENLLALYEPSAVLVFSFLAYWFKLVLDISWILF